MTPEQRDVYARNCARKVAHRPMHEVCQIVRERLGRDAKGLTVDETYIRRLLA